MNKLVEIFNEPFTYHWVSQEGTDSLDFIEDASGYIIFGSDSNVHDRLPWQISLQKKMKEKILQGVPVLGICFGHQLMADAFGAKIDLVTPDNKCFEGTRKQTFLDNHLGFTQGSDVEIFITHHYEVKELPKDFIQLSTSDDCYYDGLAHKTLPYFSVQGHPEASDHFVTNHIEIKLSADKIKAAKAGGISLIQKFIEIVNSYSAG